MTEIKNILINKTRKEHECNACLWLYESLHMIRSGEIKLTISERREIIRMKHNNWRIPKGSICRYSVQICDGDFFYAYYDEEINKICLKYDLYPDVEY